MATYQYKARDKLGKMTQGVMGADSDQAVAGRLSQMGYTPITITPTKGTSKVNVLFHQRSRTVAFADVNMFTRLLYTMQKSGIPLVRSLKAIIEQTTSKNLKDILAQAVRDIEAGSDLSSALERHPRVFNAIYVNMVRAGEVSGRLNETLERLAILGEHEEKVRLRIRAAMVYPLIVVATIIIGFMILITLVVPRFAALYGQYATVLPLPTRILMLINSLVTQFWWLVIAFLVAAPLIVKRYTSTAKGLFWWDHFRLKIPVFGPLMLKLTMSRFCRITGTLLKSGVPILQILELVAESVGNSVIARTVENIKTSVNQGKGMLDPMQDSGLFPPIVTQMVAVGEETGEVDELLLRVADYYDSQVDHTVNNLVSLIEPFLIIICGLVVIVMALGIYMPMWNMMKLFR